ncbi:MAG: MerR family transcriptional regulator [Candidatus Nanopelagicales bacterium]
MSNSLRNTRDSGFTIGEVLGALRGEFTDISISKIRFLESEGLIQPERSHSGYRKFSSDDIMRLKYILRAQKEHYLPLKVIKEHLAALDRGLAAPELPNVTPKVPTIYAVNPVRGKKSIRITEAELLTASGLDPKQLADLEKLGILKRLADKRHFDEWALKIAKIASTLANYGIEPRHLRGFKTASEREFNLIQQATTPFAKRNHPEAIAKANEMKFEIAQLTNLLQSSLIQSAIEDEIS